MHPDPRFVLPAAQEEPRPPRAASRPQLSSAGAAGPAPAPHRPAAAAGPNGPHASPPRTARPASDPRGLPLISPLPPERGEQRVWGANQEPGLPRSARPVGEAGAGGGGCRGAGGGGHRAELRAPATPVSPPPPGGSALLPELLSSLYFGGPEQGHYAEEKGEAPWECGGSCLRAYPGRGAERRAGGETRVRGRGRLPLPRRRSGARGLLPTPGISLPVASPLHPSPPLPAPPPPPVYFPGAARGGVAPVPGGEVAITTPSPPPPSSAAWEKRCSSCSFAPGPRREEFPARKLRQPPPRGERRGGSSPHPGRPDPAASSRRARVMALR